MLTRLLGLVVLLTTTLATLALAAPPARAEVLCFDRPATITGAGAIRRRICRR